MFNFGRLTSSRTRPESEVSSKSGKRKGDDDESVHSQRTSRRQSTSNSTPKRKSSLKHPSHRSVSLATSSSKLDYVDDTSSRPTLSQRNERDTSQHESRPLTRSGGNEDHARTDDGSVAIGRQERGQNQNVHEVDYFSSKDRPSAKAGHSNHSSGSHNGIGRATATNTSTGQGFDQHTAALPQNQFFSDPSTYTQPYRPPPNGHAAEYYNDNGESVQHQPGVRPNKPAYIVKEEYAHLQTPTLESRPPPEPSSIGQVGAAASFFAMHSGDEETMPLKASKPGRSSKADTAGTLRGSSRTGSSSRTRTKSEGDVRPSTSAPSQATSHVRSQLGSDVVSANVRGVGHGEAASYFNAASTFNDSAPSHETSSLPHDQRLPSASSQPGFTPYDQRNDVTAVAGLAGVATAAAAAGTSYMHDYHHPHKHANQQNVSSVYQQNSRPVYTSDSSQESPGHEHRGPISRLADWWSDPAGVRQFEEYTEYIGVCKYCFDPNAPTKGPRKHHRNLRRQGSRYGDNMRVDKKYRQDSSDDERRRTRRKAGVGTNLVGAGLLGLGAAKLGEQMYNSKHDSEDTYSVKIGQPVEETNPNQYAQHKRQNSHQESQARRHNSHGKAERRVQQQDIGRRLRRRSSSSQEEGISRGTAMSVATGAAALALAAEAADRRRARSRSHERQSKSKRYHSKRISPRHSYVDLNDTAAPAAFGIASFFTSPSANRRRGKSSKGFFTFGNGSSSSSDADLAFGAGTVRHTQSFSPSKEHGRRRKGKEKETDTTAILGLAAAGTALAAEASRRSTVSRRNRHADRDAGLQTSQYQDVRIDLHDHESTNGDNGDGWEDASDDEYLPNVDAGLAYGGGLAGGPSMESLASDPGTSKWDWRWNKKRAKQEEIGLEQRQSTNRVSQPFLYDSQYPHASLPSNVGAISAGAASVFAAERVDGLPRRTTVMPAQSVQSLQYIQPVPISQPAASVHQDHVSNEQSSERDARTEHSDNFRTPPATTYSAKARESFPSNSATVSRSNVAFDLTDEQIENEQRVVERQRRRTKTRDDTGGDQGAKVDRVHSKLTNQDTLDARGRELDAQIAALEAKRASKKRQIAQEKAGMTTGVEQPRRTLVTEVANGTQRPSSSDLSAQGNHDPHLEEHGEEYRRKELEERQRHDAQRLREQQLCEAAERTRIREIHRSQSDTSGIATTAMLAAAAAAAELTTTTEVSRDGSRQRSKSYGKRASSLKNESFADESSPDRSQPEQSSRRDVALVQSTRLSRSRSPVHEEYSRFFMPEDLREHVEEHNNKARRSNTQLVIVDAVPDASTNALSRKTPFDPELYQKFGLDDDHDPLRHPWRVPLLDLIEATPPSSQFGSSKDPMSPLVSAEKHDADVPSVEVTTIQRTMPSPKVTWGEHDTFVYDVLTPEYERRDPTDELLDRFVRSGTAEDAAVVVINDVPTGPHSSVLQSGQFTNARPLHEDETAESHRPKPERVFTLENDADEEIFMRGLGISRYDVDEQVQEDHASAHIPGAFDDEDFATATDDVTPTNLPHVNSSHGFYRSPFVHTVSDIDIPRTNPSSRQVEALPAAPVVEERGVDILTAKRALSPVLGALTKSRSARSFEENENEKPESGSQSATPSRPSRSDRRRSERASLSDPITPPSAEISNGSADRMKDVESSERDTGARTDTNGRAKSPKPNTATRDIMKGAAVAAAAAAAATFGGARTKSSRTKSQGSTSAPDTLVDMEAIPRPAESDRVQRERTAVGKHPILNQSTAYVGQDELNGDIPIVAEGVTARDSFLRTPQSGSNLCAAEDAKAKKQESEHRTEVLNDLSPSRSSASLHHAKDEYGRSRARSNSHSKDSEDDRQSVASTSTVLNAERVSTQVSRHESPEFSDVLASRPSTAPTSAEVEELAGIDHRTIDDDSMSTRSSSSKRDRKSKRRDVQDDDDVQSVQSSSRRRERKVKADDSSKSERKSGGFFSTLFSSSKSDSVKPASKGTRRSDSNITQHDHDRGEKKQKKRRSNAAHSVPDLSQALENEDGPAETRDYRDVKSEVADKDSTDDDSVADKARDRSFLAKRPEILSSTAMKHEPTGTDGVSGLKDEIAKHEDGNAAGAASVGSVIVALTEEHARPVDSLVLPEDFHAGEITKQQRVSPVPESLRSNHKDTAETVTRRSVSRTASADEARTEAFDESVYSTPLDEHQNVFEDLRATSRSGGTSATLDEARLTKVSSAHDDELVTDEKERGGHDKPVSSRPRALSIVQPSVSGSSVTSPSTTVPLFTRRFPVTPRGTTRDANSSPIHSPVSPLSAPKTRQARPKSTEFSSKEFRPLYLVERHTPAKLERVPSAERLPSLPSSRTSSVRGSSEDLRGLAVDDSVVIGQQTGAEGPRGRRHSWQSDTRPSDDYLDSRSATPTPHDRKRPADQPRERRELPKEWFHSPSELLQDPAFHAEVNLEDVGDARAASPLPSVVSTDVGDENFVSAESRTSTPVTERQIQRSPSPQTSLTAALPDSPTASRATTSSGHRASSSISGWAAAIAAGAAAVGSGIGAVIAGSGNTSEERTSEIPSHSVRDDNMRRSSVQSAEWPGESVRQGLGLTSVAPGTDIAAMNLGKDTPPSGDEHSTKKAKLDALNRTDKVPDSDSEELSHDETSNGQGDVKLGQFEAMKELGSKGSSDKPKATPESAGVYTNAAVEHDTVVVEDRSQRATAQDSTQSVAVKGIDIAEDTAKAAREESSTGEAVSARHRTSDTNSMIQRPSPPTPGSVNFEDYYRSHQSVQLASPGAHHQQMYTGHIPTYGSDQLVAAVTPDQSFPMLAYQPAPEPYSEQSTHGYSHPSPQLSYSQSAPSEYQASPHHSFVQPAAFGYAASSGHSAVHAASSDYHPSPHQTVVLPAPLEYSSPTHVSSQPVPAYGDFSSPLSSRSQSVQQVIDKSTPWPPRRTSKAEEDAAEDWYRSSLTSSVLPSVKTAEDTSSDKAAQDKGLAPTDEDKITDQPVDVAKATLERYTRDSESVDDQRKQETDSSTDVHPMDETAAQVPLPEVSADELEVLRDTSLPMEEHQQGTGPVDDTGAVHTTIEATLDLPPQVDDKSVSLFQGEEEEEWNMPTRKSKKDKKKRSSKNKSTNFEDLSSPTIDTGRSEAVGVLTRGAIGAITAAAALLVGVESKTEDEMSPASSNNTAEARKESRKDKKKGKRRSIFIEDDSQAFDDAALVREVSHEEGDDNDTESIAVIATPTVSTDNGQTHLDNVAAKVQEAQGAKDFVAITEDSTAMLAVTAPHKEGKSELPQDTDSQSITTKNAAEDVGFSAPAEADDTEWATTGKNSKKNKKKSRKQTSTEAEIASPSRTLRVSEPEAELQQSDDIEKSIPENEHESAEGTSRQVVEDDSITMTTGKKSKRDKKNSKWASTTKELPALLTPGIDDDATANVQSTVSGKAHASAADRDESSSRLSSERELESGKLPAVGHNNTMQAPEDYASHAESHAVVTPLDSLPSADDVEKGVTVELQASTQADNTREDAGIQEADDEFAWTSSSKKSKKGKKKGKQSTVDFLPESADTGVPPGSRTQRTEEVSTDNNTAAGSSEQRQVDGGIPDEEYAMPTTTKKGRKEKKKKRSMLEDPEVFEDTSSNVEKTSEATKDKTVTVSPDKELTEERSIKPDDANDTRAEDDEWALSTPKKKKKDKKKRNLIIEYVETDIASTPSNEALSAVEPQMPDEDRSAKVEARAVDNSNELHKDQENTSIVEQLVNPNPGVTISADTAADGGSKEGEPDQTESRKDIDADSAVADISPSPVHGKSARAQNTDLTDSCEETRALQTPSPSLDRNQHPSAGEDNLSKASIESSTKLAAEGPDMLDDQNTPHLKSRSTDDSPHASVHVTPTSTQPQTEAVTTSSPKVTTASALDRVDVKESTGAETSITDAVAEHKDLDTKHQDTVDPKPDRSDHIDDQDDSIVTEDQIWAPIVKKSKKDKKKMRSKGEAFDESQGGLKNPSIIDNEFGTIDRAQEASNHEGVAPATATVDVEEEWTVPVKKSKKEKKKKKGKSDPEDDSERVDVDENTELDSVSLSQTDAPAAMDSAAHDKHESPADTQSEDTSTRTQSGVVKSSEEVTEADAPRSFEIEAQDDEWAMPTKKSKKDKKKKEASKLGDNTSGTQTPKDDEDSAIQQSHPANDAHKQSSQDHQEAISTDKALDRNAETPGLASPRQPKEEIAPTDAPAEEIEDVKITKGEIVSIPEQDKRPGLVGHEEPGVVTQVFRAASSLVEGIFNKGSAEAKVDSSSKPGAELNSEDIHDHNDDDAKAASRADMLEDVTDTQQGANTETLGVSASDVAMRLPTEHPGRTLEHEDRARDELEVDNLVIPGSFFEGGEESNDNQNVTTSVLQRENASARTNDPVKPTVASPDHQICSPDKDEHGAPGASIEREDQEKAAVSVPHFVPMHDIEDDLQKSATTDDSSKPRESRSSPPGDGEATGQSILPGSTQEPDSETTADQTVTGRKVDVELTKVQTGVLSEPPTSGDINAESAADFAEDEWASTTKKSKKDKKNKKKQATFNDSKLDTSTLSTSGQVKANDALDPLVPDQDIVGVRSTSIEDSPAADTLNNEADEVSTIAAQIVSLEPVEDADEWSFSSKKSRKDKKKKTKSVSIEHDSSMEASTPRSIETSGIKSIDDKSAASTNGPHEDTGTRDLTEGTAVRESLPDVLTAEILIKQGEAPSNQSPIYGRGHSDSQTSKTEHEVSDLVLPATEHETDTHDFFKHEHENKTLDSARGIAAPTQHIEATSVQDALESDTIVSEATQESSAQETVESYKNIPDHSDVAGTIQPLTSDKKELATDDGSSMPVTEPGKTKTRATQSASDEIGVSPDTTKDEHPTQEAAAATSPPALKDYTAVVMSARDVQSTDLIPEDSNEEDLWAPSSKKSKKDKKSKKKAKTGYFDIEPSTTFDEPAQTTRETGVPEDKEDFEQQSRFTELVDTVSAQATGDAQHEDISSVRSKKSKKKDKSFATEAEHLSDDKMVDEASVKQAADLKDDSLIEAPRDLSVAVSTDGGPTIDALAEDEWTEPSKKSKKDKKKRKSTKIDDPAREQSPEPVTRNEPLGGQDVSAGPDQNDHAMRGDGPDEMVARAGGEDDLDLQERNAPSEHVASTKAVIDPVKSSRQAGTAHHEPRSEDTTDNAPLNSESAQLEEPEEWASPFKRSKKDKKKRKSAARVESSYDATPQESSTDVAASDRQSDKNLARALSNPPQESRHNLERAEPALESVDTAASASIREEAPSALQEDHDSGTSKALAAADLSNTHESKDSAHPDSNIESFMGATRAADDSDGSQVSESTRERRRRRRSPRLQVDHDPEDLPRLSKDRAVTPPPDHDDMMDTALSIAAGLGLGAAAAMTSPSHDASTRRKEAAPTEESTSWSFAKLGQPQNSHRDSAMQIDDSPVEFQAEFRQNRDSGYIASPRLGDHEATPLSGREKRYSPGSSRQARSRSPTSSTEDVRAGRQLSSKQTPKIDPVSRGESPTLARSSPVVPTIPVEIIDPPMTSPIERPRSGLRSHRGSHGDLRAQARSPLSQRDSPPIRRESSSYGVPRSPHTFGAEEMSASLLHRVRTAEIDRASFNQSPRLEQQFSPRQSIERPFSPKSPLETINENGLAMGAVALGLAGGVALMSRGSGDGSLGTIKSRSASLHQQQTGPGVQGGTRSVSMSDALEGVGVSAGAGTSSPIRPPSLRSRKSLTQISDLQTRVEQLATENKQLAESKQLAERHIEELQFEHSKHDYATREALQTVNEQLRLRDEEITRLRVEIQNLQSARDALRDEHDQKYTLLLNEKDRAHAQLQEHTRELDTWRSQNDERSTGLQGTVAAQIAAAVASKDSELQKLQEELAQARAKIRELQSQIIARGFDEVVELRDEDYFDAACQALCQHVQQWVLRFSKFSDNRVCRSTAEVKDEKVVDRFDNAILDGTDVDLYLRDRVKRRDVFMSVVMTMIWEFVFTRYLFGMDRDQRQKLKQLEKNLTEVGPVSAVHQWRALTLTLLAKRAQFKQQKESDTEAVTTEIVQTLAKFLPPPQNLEAQIYESLRNVMRAAIKLSIEMRTQKAEYIMLPPLQPEYDTNGDLARKVYFNAALMNERSGETSSNDDLEQEQAIVRMVLFPLVVKKGDDRGSGEEEIVVCPAQVLIARPDKGKRRSTRTLAEGDRAQSRISQAAMMSSQSIQLV